MTALVVAKTLTLLSQVLLKPELVVATLQLSGACVGLQGGMYHYIRATGSPDGWNIAFYVFTFLRGVLFFTVSVRL